MPVQTIERAKLDIDIVTPAEFQRTINLARTNRWPEHWPPNVREISLEGLSLIGLDHEGGIYLDGKRLYAARRLDTQERWMAWIVTLSTFVGAAAALAPLLGLG